MQKLWKEEKKNHLQQIEAPSEQLIFSHGQLNYRPGAPHLLPLPGEVRRLPACTRRVIGTYMVIM